MKFKDTVSWETQQKMAGEMGKVRTSHGEMWNSRERGGGKERRETPFREELRMNGRQKQIKEQSVKRVKHVSTQCMRVKRMET